MASEWLGLEGAGVPLVGAGGIASACAKGFSDPGAKVLWADLHQDRVGEVAGQLDLEHNGGDSLLLGATDVSSYREAVRTAQQRFGAALRYVNASSHRQREVAILELSQLERCDFERYAHERLDRAMGLTSGAPYFSVSSI
jgi:NAD(P)-dependent dehydrogenase (short-subunit alcohol dehydrogenase family)